MHFFVNKLWIPKIGSKTSSKNKDRMEKQNKKEKLDDIIFYFEQDIKVGLSNPCGVQSETNHRSNKLEHMNHFFGIKYNTRR
jgi:hypothetical protein